MLQTFFIVWLRDLYEFLLMACWAFGNVMSDRNARNGVAGWGRPWLFIYDLGRAALYVGKSHHYVYIPEPTKDWV